MCGDAVLCFGMPARRGRLIGSFTEAADAPKRPLAEALGRLLYLVHLAVLLWWLLDKSPRQRATTGLVALLAGG